MTAPLPPGHVRAWGRCLGLPWSDEMVRMLREGAASGLPDWRIAEQIERATGRVVTANAVRDKRGREAIDPGGRSGIPVNRPMTWGDYGSPRTRPRTCQFIAGDPREDATMCGDRVTRGAYCEAHAAVCYRVDDGEA